jgi:hypothetical protein
MTVKELINHLQQFEQETEVMFSFVDATDFQYTVDITEDDIFMGDPTNDYSDFPDEMYNEEWDYIGPEVVLFNLSLDD